MFFRLYRQPPGKKFPDREPRASFEDTANPPEVADRLLSGYNRKPRFCKTGPGREETRPPVADDSLSKTDPASSSDGDLGLAGLLSSVGPGLVYALTVLGTGDIVSNTAAGASYGYRLIWALGMTLIFRYVWVNVSAKYVLVTGESLLKGYGRVGPWVPLIVLLSFFPIRHFANQYLILMMGLSAHMLFPLPTEWSSQIWACLFTAVGFAMMFWGGYPAIEAFCKVLVGIMGGSSSVGGADRLRRQ